MSYGTISNEWLNKNNLETLWAAIVRDFVHAGANPVSGGDGGTTKGAIPYWGANSTPTGTGQPIQPSHLQIGSVGQFIGVSSNGIPEWTTPQILQAGGSSSTALTLYLKNASSVALTLQVADETQWGILTDGTQTLGGDKTFAGHVHGNKNIEASWGMSANGIADLAFGESGGGGTVTRLVLCGTDYEPEGGVITVPASSLRTGLGLGMAAYKNIGVVTSGDMNLVTGDAVNSAINSALTAAMKIEGETTTNVITNPTANPVTIDGQSVSAYKGMVVFYSSKEFVWTGSSWKELGDEGSFALKTITITGTGYLGGGGDLSVNRSLDLTDTAKGYITEGRNAYGYFTDGILDAAHMSAANIVSALGTTPVNRAIADKDGNDITTQYAVASTTAASIGQLYVMATDNYDSIQLIDERLYDIEPYVYEMMQVARPDVDNSELNIIGSLNASRNIHASWGVCANGIADLAFGGGGGGGTITQIQIDGVPQEDVDGIVNLPAYPNIEGLASQTWVTAEISALNLGTASTHAHTDYVTGITWNSSTRKLKQSKGGGAATDIVQFGTAYSHNHAEYVTVIAANGDDLSITKGSENPVLLTVPYATLSTDTKTELLTEQEFTYRQTAGGGLIYKPSSAVLKRILGRTLVWNQQMNPSTISIVTQGITNITFSNGIYTYTLNDQISGVHGTGIGMLNFTFVTSHKYFYGCDFNIVPENLVYFYFRGTGTNVEVALGTSTKIRGIYACTQTETAYETFIGFVLSGPSSGEIKQSNYNLIDLTLMFGAGNEPSTVEEFEALYPNAYYEYNPGQLINNSAEGLETIGFNLWDEEWESKKGINNSGTISSVNGYSVTKNFISVKPNTSYYFKSATELYAYEYDINGTAIGWLYASNNNNCQNIAVTTKANTAYLKFFWHSETLAANDICINKSDSAKNGTYEPYKRNVLPLNLNSFRVKDAQGNIVTINGLKKAGSVYDEIVGKKFIQRVGSVDLGSLTWTADSTSTSGKYRMGTSLSDAKRPIDTVTAFTGICSKYLPIGSVSTYTCQLGISLEPNSNNLRVYDSAYDTSSSSAAFKTAMSGVILNYALASPIEYEIIDDFPTTYPIDVLGTEGIVSDEMVAPFIGDIQYGAKQKDFALDINNVFTGLTSRIDAMDISHYQSSQTSAVDTHVITINGKKFYLKFNVTEADSSVSPQIMPAFDLEVSDSDDNTGNVQSFSFGTMSESEITSICHL